MTRPYFLARDLHPGAWWLWALGLAAAASRTTNPWLLVMVLVVVCHVVVSRRSDAPWAMAFRLYLYFGALIIVIRVAFRVIFGGAEGAFVLLPLPEIQLPVWAAGIRLFGDVYAESLLDGLYEGLRLATMVICVGAANALANPKRLIKSMPSALYEVGTAVVVAISVFPQLAESVQRVRKARLLRGGSGKGIPSLRAIVIPVLEDALDRSIQLASSMDSRGYGRAGEADKSQRIVTGCLMVVGLIGLCVGIYATLDATTPRYLGGPFLLVGAIAGLGGFYWSGRRAQHTRYRPDRWHLAEIVTAGAGAIVAVILVMSSAALPLIFYPAVSPLSWPPLPMFGLVGIAVGLLPAFLSPPPADTHGTTSEDIEAVA